MRGFARSLPAGPIRLASRESVRCQFCGPALDRKRRRWNAQCARWADKCFCLNPDLLQFVPGAEFLPYASYGEIGRRQPAGGPERPLRVVHAPTKRAVKGTDIIMAASAALQASQPHELVIVENCPREEALRRYAEADVLVDQVRIGWYGGLAVEAMSMGDSGRCLPRCGRLGDGSRGDAGRVAGGECLAGYVAGRVGPAAG